LYYLLPRLGTFADLRKATVISVMSVSLFATKNSAPYSRVKNPRLLTLEDGTGRLFRNVGW